MIVDSDQYTGTPICPAFCAEVPQFCFFDGFNACQLGALSTDVEGDCYDEIGAGVIQPIGNDASNKDKQCGFQEGLRYMNTDTDNIDEILPCALKVGTSGHHLERPLGALYHAITTLKNTCNEGFIRDGAALVIVLITDENDSSDVSVSEVFQGLIEAKNKVDTQGIAILGIINPLGLGDNQASINELIAGIKDHDIISIEEPNYAPHFTEAVQGVISDACKVAQN